MKKYLLIATAFVALAGCSDDTFVGENSPNANENYGGAINFGSGLKAVTRTDHVGADAASMLNNHFTVGGFKGNGTTRTTVFDNYVVNWTENTAGKTTSNTNDWEYVGLDIAQPSSLYISDTSSPDYPAKQTIKYWDYSTSQYDFIAYSTGAKTATTGDPASGTSVQVTAIDPANLTTAAYKLQAASRADLAGCYVADMVTAYKADDPATYGKEVKLTFRSLASKVRIALYETVPGYSVKTVKFYSAHPTTLGTGSSEDNAVLIGAMNDAGTYTVKFPTIGSSNKNDPDYNKAHVSFVASTSTSSYQAYGALTNQYTTKEYRETGTKYLGRTSNTATFAGTGTFYQTVLPNETGEVFELAIDYTLESIDGSGEEINVYGATAYIPVQFTKWQPNFAYTYIFKISDNTNGWTSKVTTDPAGLYPITFDAVVIDSEEENTQSTITTVTAPSITTYQVGHNYKTSGPEYKPGTIYVQVMVGSTLKGDLGSKGQLYILSADKTETDVLDALNIRTTPVVDGYDITGRNGLSLKEATSDATITSILGEDGNPIGITAGQAASFTATAQTYAYVYDTDTWNGIAVKYTSKPTGWPTGWYKNKACTEAASDGDYANNTTFYKREGYIYSAETMTSTTPSDWTTEGLWWKDPDGTVAAGAWDAANNGKVFYKRYTANTKIYGVKVIKVQ